MDSAFKDIPGYEGLYKISTCGAVISVARDRILSPTRHKDGYLLVGLSKNSNRKFFTIHRLVMLAFVGSSDCHVNHRNGIKDDNRLENLEYVSPKENQQHALEVGLIKKGVKPPIKLNFQLAEEIRTTSGVSNYELARRYGVSEKAIRNIKNKISWKLTKETPT